MTSTSFVRTTWFLALLLTAGAALFAIGISAERSNSDHHTENSATVTTVHNEASESGAEGGSEAGSEPTPHAEGSSTESGEHSESGEKIFEINTDSSGAVAVGVALSLALAVLVLLRPRPPLFLAVVAFAGVFAALDLGEAIHQIDNSRAGVAAIAFTLALLHAAAALLAMPRTALVDSAG